MSCVKCVQYAHKKNSNTCFKVTSSSISLSYTLLSWSNFTSRALQGFTELGLKCSCYYNNSQSFISPSSSSSSTPRIYKTLLHLIKTSPKFPVGNASIYSSVLAN